MDSPLTDEAMRQKLATGATGRHIFLFKYPSDGLQIKGFISFMPDPVGQHLVIALRGGNEVYGLLHPASDFVCIKNYTILTTTLRGGVSEGQDEFGRSDVNDVAPRDNLKDSISYPQRINGLKSIKSPLQ